MYSVHSASDLRRWAMRCFDDANGPLVSGEEREKLLKMREGLLSLAETEDWLAGRTRALQAVAGRRTGQDMR
jgi:hypothetical protein